MSSEYIFPYIVVGCQLPCSKGTASGNSCQHVEFDLLVVLVPQDLPNAMNAAEITDKLGLHALRNRNWYIQATCATSGDGLYEGLDWLSNQLKKAN